jgi:hypothetical protein
MCSQLGKDNIDKKKDFVIQRPIIFICNEFYTKAIRPLRELTLPIKIFDCDPKRLLDRLRFIAKKE